MVEEVRGEGLFSGIAFRPPRSLTLRFAFEAFSQIHPAMFGQVLVMRLFRDHGILAQICGNNFPGVETDPTVDRQPPANRRGRGSGVPGCKAGAFSGSVLERGSWIGETGRECLIAIGAYASLAAVPPAWLLYCSGTNRV